MRLISIEETIAVSGGGTCRPNPCRQRRPRWRLCLPDRSYQERAKARQARPA